jgi:hypothetical protein
MKTFWAEEAGAAAARSKRPNIKPGDFMQALILASDIGESMMSFAEGKIEREIFFGVKIVNAGTCDGRVDISAEVAGRILP